MAIEALALTLRFSALPTGTGRPSAGNKKPGREAGFLILYASERLKRSEP